MYFSQSADLLLRIFAVLSKGCGIWLFSTDQPFQSVGTGQPELFGMICSMAVKETDHTTILKKLITLICVFLMLFAICALPAIAEALAPAVEVQEVETIMTEPAPTPGELPNEFTWKYLASTAGAAALAFAVVQFIKAPLDNVWKIPTRLLVYLLCLITLLIANAFLNHGLTIEMGALSVFNALISAYTAYGLYEVFIRKKESAAPKA